MHPDRHKESRYKILKALHYAYPYGMTELAIFRALNEISPDLMERDVAAEVVYLREKKYIKTEKRFDRAIREEVRTHYIVPQGIDLLEGNIEGGDPGIYLPEIN